MTIGTPMGSPNWAAHYFIKRQAEKISVPIANKNMQPGTGSVLPFLCLPLPHNNSTIFNSAIATCVFTRKDYPGSARDHPPEIGQPFEG